MPGMKENNFILLALCQNGASGVEALVFMAKPE